MDTYCDQVKIIIQCTYILGAVLLFISKISPVIIYRQFNHPYVFYSQKLFVGTLIKSNIGNQNEKLTLWTSAIWSKRN